MKKINIGKDFSHDPAGRYYSDGEGSGEAFREEILKESIKDLKEGEKITFVLDDDIESYGSSFLTEGFAGMVKYGYITSEELLPKLSFQYTDKDFEFYKNKIIQYIKEAKYNSEKYVKTEPLKKQ